MGVVEDELLYHPETEGIAFPPHPEAMDRDVVYHRFPLRVFVCPGEIVDGAGGEHLDGKVFV